MTDAGIAGLLRAVGFFDSISLWSGRIVGWLIIPMVMSLVWEVVARYCFNAPTVWAYDMTYMLYGAFFMLGSAYTLMRGGHIRTDSLYGAMAAAAAGARRRHLLPRVLLPAADRAALRHLGLLLAVVSARRTRRVEPVDAGHLPAEIRHAGHLRAAAAAGHRPSSCASIHAFRTGEWLPRPTLMPGVEKGDV